MGSYYRVKGSSEVGVFFKRDRKNKKPIIYLRMFSDSKLKAFTPDQLIWCHRSGIPK